MQRLLVLGMLYILSISSVYAAPPTSCLPQSIKNQLNYINNNFGKVRIISTHRPGARTPKGTRSYHASCRAVDFYVSKNQSAAARYLKANWNGGVGTYSGRHNHIHIDNGPRYRWHTATGSRTRIYTKKIRKGKANNRVYTKTRSNVKRSGKVSGWSMNWAAN